MAISLVLPSITYATYATRHVEPMEGVSKESPEFLKIESKIEKAGKPRGIFTSIRTIEYDSPEIPLYLSGGTRVLSGGRHVEILIRESPSGLLPYTTLLSESTIAINYAILDRRRFLEAQKGKRYSPKELSKLDFASLRSTELEQLRYILRMEKEALAFSLSIHPDYLPLHSHRRSELHENLDLFRSILDRTESEDLFEPSPREFPFGERSEQSSLNLMRDRLCHLIEDFMISYRSKALSERLLTLAEINFILRQEQNLSYEEFEEILRLVATYFELLEKEATDTPAKLLTHEIGLLSFVRHSLLLMEEDKNSTSFRLISLENIQTPRDILGALHARGIQSFKSRNLPPRFRGR